MEESHGHGWNKPFHPDDQKRAWDAWQVATTKLAEYSLECRLRRKDGEYRWWLIRGVPLRAAAGNVLKWFGTCTDIHDSKLAEETLRRLNRELRAISNCNQILVRAMDEQTLLNDICRIVCDEAGYRMAWVGLAEKDEAKTVRPVAWAGFEEGYLTNAQITWADTERGCGPTGTAIRSRESIYIKDFTTDPKVVAWRENARLRGYRSSIALPLKEETGNVFGALTIYSTEPNAFTPDERRLLEGLAGDLAFGIVVLRTRAERKRAEAALRESEARYRALFDSSPDGIVIADVETKKFKYVNPALCRMLGYAEAELHALGVADIHPPEALPHVAAEFEAQTRGDKTLTAGLPCLRKDGSVVYADINASKVIVDGQPCAVGFFRDITERKRIEQGLRETEERFAAAFQASPNLIVITRMADGKIVDVNEGYTKLLGYSREESIGKTTAGLSIWANPADRATFAGTLEKFGEINNFETTLRRKDGTFVTVLDSARTIELQGETCILSAVSDITERKQAEEALQRERELFNCLIRTIPDCIYFKDRQSRFVRINESMARRFGLHAAAEAVGKTDFDIFSTEHARQAEGDEQRAMETGEPIIGLEEKETWPDGRVTWASTTKVPLRDAEGKITGLVGISRDITERKQLTEAHARLAMAVEQATESIIITDTKGVILYVNPAFEKITGYTSAEAIGQNPRILKSGRHDAKFYRQMWEVLAYGENWVGHFTNRRKDGTIYEEEATISPIRDAAGEIINYVAVKRDVTREVQLEDQYRQAQKMEAFGQLAGGVAHDFNNILAVIQLQAGVLKVEQSLTPVQLDYAHEIEKAAQRGADLTQQLLLFSRKQTMQAKNLDLKGLVESIAKMLRRTLGENFELQMKFAQETLIIHADAGMMDQILLNLTVNARDAMPNGGKISIETSAADFDEVTAAQNHQVRPGSFVCLSVSDTGCGIRPEILPRIFEPFFTTKEVGKGTGLGLAIVFSIVQQHQGWITVYSEVGRGTTFRVYLPRQAKPSDTEFFWSKPASLCGGHETILLVEDEVSLRAVVRVALSRLGYRMLEASNGAEAVAIWQQHRDEIRLLLTDLVMPGGMNGKELAAQLLQEKPKLIVIYISGYTADVAGKDLVLEEGVNFLSKPFQSQLLALTIRKRLDQD